MGSLVVDDDPFGAGADKGFSLVGATNNPKLKSVKNAEDDPNDLILTFDKVPKGDAIELLYAFAQSPDRSDEDYPAACGAIRDDWSMTSKTGVTLHRWALPAVLQVW